MCLYLYKVNVQESMKISISETRQQVKKVMETAMAGEEVIVTRRDKPMVKVVKVEEDHPCAPFPKLSDFRKKWSIEATESSVLRMREEDNPE